MHFIGKKNRRFSDLKEYIKRQFTTNIFLKTLKKKHCGFVCISDKSKQTTTKQKQMQFVNILLSQQTPLSLHP